jgi:acyl carrier protein
MSAPGTVIWKATGRNTTVEDEVKAVLGELLMADIEELTPETLLVEDLSMDSLDRVEIAMRLEEELLNEQPIDEDEAEGWRTVGDVVRTVERMAGRGKKQRATA